ncbi:hypothetical protein [Clostridium sp. HBUAS56017]|uniref:PGAP1-like alpha/beta domain-containing protein n=1 Tax=Clostridium sp. HBUAS56017 TaxID=2571128 RepID=UPI001177AA2A|nr:hypothetical protein [Clostridium sp. HBUAS56017]
MKNKYTKTIIMFLSLTIFLSLFTNFNLTTKASTVTTKEKDISLILDISNNLPSQSKKEFNTACSNFCKNILSKSPNSKISIITADKTKNILSFTSDAKELNERITSALTSEETDINECLQISNDLFTSNSPSNSDKSIVILNNELSNNTFSSQDKYNSCENYTSSISSYIKNLSSKYEIYSLSYLNNSAKNDNSLLQKSLKNIIPKNYHETNNIKSLSSELNAISKKLTSSPPIIIIPGIMGSRLYKDSDCTVQIWDPIVKLNPSDENSIYNLGKNINISSTLFTKKVVNQVPLSTSEREYGAQNSYKNLVDTICNEFPDREVYFFSYDFRKSNVSAGEQLKDFIDNTLNVSKVDLVCHSMGGIVASNYATLDTSKIDKVITLGTPYEGAPTLINSVLNWSILSEDWNKTDFALGVCGLTKKVKSGFSGVAELYPTRNYFDAVGFSSKFKDGLFSSHISQIDYSKYSEYGKTIFQNIYDSCVAEQEGITLNGSNILSTLNNSYFAIGTGEKTISSLVFKNGNTLDSIDVSSLVYENNGDGTVPKLSSTMIGGLDNVNSNNVKYFSETTHGGLVNSSNPIKWTTDILKQGTSTLGNKTITNGKPYIVMRIDSPTTATIEKNGEILNSDTVSTNFSSYGRLDRIGENGNIKMAAIDEDNNCNVTFHGTDKGKMDYDMSWYDENNNLKEERHFDNIPIEKGTKIFTTTDKSNPTELQIDEDGNGEIDKIVKSDKDKQDEQVLLTLNDSDSNNSGGNMTEAIATNTSSLDESKSITNSNINILTCIIIITLIASSMAIAITVINKKKKSN